MLILSRRPGQVLRILPGPEVDPSTPVATLFDHGPIEIIVARVLGVHVRLGISAHPQLIVLRRELVQPDG